MKNNYFLYVLLCIGLQSMIIVTFEKIVNQPDEVEQVMRGRHVNESERLDKNHKQQMKELDDQHTANILATDITNKENIKINQDRRRFGHGVTLDELPLEQKSDQVERQYQKDRERLQQQQDLQKENLLATQLEELNERSIKSDEKKQLDRDKGKNIWGNKANSQKIVESLMDGDMPANEANFKNLTEEIIGDKFFGRNREKRLENIIRVLNEKPRSKVAQAIATHLQGLKDMNQGIHFDESSGTFQLVKNKAQYEQKVELLKPLIDGYGKKIFEELFGTPTNDKDLQSKINIEIQKIKSERPNISGSNLRNKVLKNLVTEYKNRLLKQSKDKLTIQEIM